MKKTAHTKSDTLDVEDKNGRRRFIRAGAAFLLAGSAVASAQEESENFRSDCDSRGGVGAKDAEVAGNDNDAGAVADRPGCGRIKPPTITEYNKGDTRPVTVAKVKV